MTTVNWIEGFKIASSSDRERLETIILEELQRKYHSTQFSVRIPISKIRTASDPYKVMMCTGYFGETKAICAVACKHWNNLIPSDQERKSGEIDLIAHLPELLPKDRSAIGLVTYQNGILNTPNNFESMGNSILKHLQEGTLLIGLYNPTYGLTNDFARLSNSELRGNDTESTWRTRQMFNTLAKHLSTIPGNIRILHIAHSEAGLICKLALSSIAPQYRSLFRSRMLVATYGAVAPISKILVWEAINTYSEDDKAALQFGKLHARDPDAAIRFVYGKMPKSRQDFFGGDHAFEGETYQAALKTNIDNFKARYGI